MVVRRRINCYDMGIEVNGAGWFEFLWWTDQLGFSFPILKFFPVVANVGFRKSVLLNMVEVLSDFVQLRIPWH